MGEQRAFVSVLGGLINGGSVHPWGGAAPKGSSPLLDLLHTDGGGEKQSTGPLAASSVDHPSDWEPRQSPRSRSANPSYAADVTHCNPFVCYSSFPLKKALCCSLKRGEEDKAYVCVVLKCYLVLLFQVPHQHILRCVWEVPLLPLNCVLMGRKYHPEYT